METILSLAAELLKSCDLMLKSHVENTLVSGNFSLFNKIKLLEDIYIFISKLCQEK